MFPVIKRPVSAPAPAPVKAPLRSTFIKSRGAIHYNIFEAIKAKGCSNCGSIK